MGEDNLKELIKELIDSKLKEYDNKFIIVEDKVSKMESNYNLLDRSVVKMEIMMSNFGNLFDKLENKLDIFMTKQEKKEDKKSDRNYDWLKFAGTTLLGGIIGYVLMKVGLK